ncbi:hypothetical protein AQUCO_02800009v1 [Aquilegia coerulea]|uniref:Disease resistance protein At4g27190-like leucine-rich repeats domain-containing protein n=1 Tax=Aquilegia coerulea TaxID=218851 RepID=A0A2G5D3I4_AQUCA|nr:hypothetical protein AQUCO_02800009v1 [Aquilegia coerulea]PIA38072.1 hypothetical protein AQUCO_02800009v1 [Aquilegia coerulea]
MVKVPSVSTYPNLQQLCLKSCEYLEELPHLGLRKLEVLDLSGSTNFKRFQDDSFANMRQLQILNLSATQVEKLPSLAECHILCQLLLRDCAKLETIPHLEAHETLEVLDLSGSNSFMEFQDQSFQQMDELEIVNLSGTRIEKLPSFSKCPKLRQLLMKGCACLKELPPLELKNLEILDLSDCACLKELPPLELKNLEILNLSETQVSRLPELSKCSFLSDLVLRSSGKLLTIPHLEALERLEVLDLSGPTSFQKLQYKSLEPHPKVFTNFEVLDFSCMQIRDFPDGSSKWTDLRFLGLLNQKYLWDFDWGNTEEASKQLKVDPHKSDDVGITAIRIISSNINLFNFMKTSSELWEKYFQKFQYCLCSPKEWEKEKDIYLHQRRVVFKDIYYPASQIPHSTAPDHVFEICGFSILPAIIDEVLGHVKILYLKKNSFITRLSDLGAGKVKVIRECWIERCDSMECAFYGEEKEANVAFGRVLENIWVSNLSKLRSLFSGDMQPLSFTCLKHLSIDCCPSLVTVFSSHLELVNLETLKIKFCDKVENIFGESESGEQILPKLNTLTLWRLPEMQNICGGELPSLKIVRVKGCSKLLKLPVSANNASSVINIRGEVIWWNNLIWEDKGITSRLLFTELHRFL